MLKFLPEGSKGGGMDDSPTSSLPHIAAFVQVVDGEQALLPMAIHDLQHQNHELLKKLESRLK